MKAARPRAWATFADSPDLHSLALLMPVVGVYHVSIGLVYGLQDDWRFGPPFALALSLLPSQVWGLLFVACGAAVLVGSVVRSFRPARLGLYATMLLDFTWAMTFLLNGIGEPLATWSSAVIWTGWAAVARVLAYLLPSR